MRPAHGPAFVDRADPHRLGAGVVVGALIGRTAGPGQIGKLVIQAIKVAAGPLLMLAIINAVLTAQVTARNGLRMLVLATINASIALLLGLTLSNVFQPGRHLSQLAAPAHSAPMVSGRLEPIKVFAGFVPANLVQPFAEHSVAQLVIMALLLGFALRKLKDAGEGEQSLERAFVALQSAMEIILGWIIRLAPVAVFAVVAKAVGEHGLSPLRGLAAYVFIGLVGLAAPSGHLPTVAGLFRPHAPQGVLAGGARSRGLLHRRQLELSDVADDAQSA